MFQEGRQVTRGRIDATNGSRTCHSNPFAPCPSLQGRFLVAHSASVTHEVLRKKASSPSAHGVRHGATLGEYLSSSLLPEPSLQVGTPFAVCNRQEPITKERCDEGSH